MCPSQWDHGGGSNEDRRYTSYAGNDPVNLLDPSGLLDVSNCQDNGVDGLFSMTSLVRASSFLSLILSIRASSSSASAVIAALPPAQDDVFGSFGQKG